MSDSNDIREEFSPLLDDELSPDARDAVERELAQDSELLRELHAMRKVDELYRGLPSASAPSDMAARVRNELRAKTDVTPMRRRRIPVALYSGLAAAAMFTVLVGGVVIRQEFFVSPSAEERAMQAVQSEAVREGATLAPAPAEAEAAPEVARKATGDAPDLAAAADSVEATAAEERLSVSEMDRDDAIEAGVRFRQQPADEAQAAEPQPGRVAAGGARDEELKKEAAEMPQAAQAAAAPPPPPRPAPSAGVSIGQSAGESAAESAPVAKAPEEQARNVFADSLGAEKRSNAIERIADREFERREDGWYQRGYKGEPATVVRRGTETLAALAPKIEKFDAMLRLRGDVVFRIDDNWYRIPAEAADGR